MKSTEPLPVDETTTFPKLLAELDRRYGDGRVALQEKRYGIWQPTTWRQFHDRVRDFAHGLASLRVRKSPRGAYEAGRTAARRREQEIADELRGEAAATDV